MINIYKRKIKVNLGDNQGEFFCAGYSRKGTADTIALSDQMKEGSSSFTKGEIVGVTLDLPTRIKQAMLDGQAVKINGLGTFKPSLTVSKVQADADDLKASAVTIKGINFKPDAELLSDLNAKAEYQWISASAADSEDSDDDDDSKDGENESEGENAGGSSTTPTGQTDMEG